MRVSNSSALGGALRAANAVGGLAWADLFARFAAPDEGQAVSPDPAAVAAYRDLGAAFDGRLEEVLA